MTRFDGMLPEDAPDPRQRTIEQLRDMPVPILGLVPRPHVEDWGALGVETGRRNGVLDRIAVVVGYTLWRNPADRADPAKLAVLDDRTRRALEESPPWPRPKWITDTVERMRCPMLWEAVRTRWNRDDAGRTTVAAELTRRVNHLLVNRYHAEWTRSPALLEHGPRQHVDERHVEHGVPVVVNGVAVSEVGLDTDPFVFGVGADLGAGGVLTAVVDRDAVALVVLEFAERPAPN